MMPGRTAPVRGACPRGGARHPPWCLKALRAAVRRTAAGPPPGPGSAGGAFRDGLLCNALNPKAAVFFLALLPQFLPASPGPAAVAITLLWFCAVANLVAAFRRLFARPGGRRTLDGFSGAALLGLGARLALTR